MLGRIARLTGGGTLLLVAATASVGAQLVSNGGFETPNVAGNYTSFSTGGSFAGWDVVGAGNVAVIGTNYGAAHSGSQWLDLTGTSNQTSGVEQSIATTNGASYDLSFWVGNSSADNSATSTALVFINGTQVATATNSTDNAAMFWEQFNESFTATGSATTIAFENGDGPYDSRNGLDDVALTETSGGVTTTPEPSSMALLGTGLFGLIPMVRQRRKR